MSYGLRNVDAQFTPGIEISKENLRIEVTVRINELFSGFLLKCHPRQEIF
jgi:hypothetical protein